MLLSLTTHNDSWQSKQTRFQPFEAETVDELAEMICRYAYSPAVFKGNYRRQENFLCAQLAVLDFDDGVRSIAEAKDWLETYPYQFILGTTRSHQKDKNGKVCDRYRAIIPGTSIVKDLQVFRANMRRVIDAYGSDRACADGARFYYPCIDIYAVRSKGLTLDWNHKLYESYERTKDLVRQATLYSRSGVIPSWIKKAAMGSRAGCRNNDAFKLGCGFFAMGWTLERALDFLKKTPIGTLPEPELIAALKNGFRRAEQDLADAEKNTGTMVAPDETVERSQS